MRHIRKLTGVHANPGVMHGTRDNLCNHVYAKLIERPTWAYIGAPRQDEHGRPYTAQHFSLHHHGTPGLAFVWTMDDQFDAVKRGFFLHRSGEADRVNVIMIDHFKYNIEDGPAFIQAGAFNNPNAYPNIWFRAIRFIKQQDQFGYAGAWDKRVQFYNNHLTWYRDYRVMKRNEHTLSKRDLKVREAAIKRAAAGDNLRKHAYAAYISRHYIKGET